MEFICNDCPRSCGALRSDTKCGGICASPAQPVIARAAAHFGEEPCISGKRGSGTIFFSGCNLRCCFCQNHEISRPSSLGKAVSIQELRDIMLRLRDEGVHNINLVTPTHFSRAIAEALDGLELGIPVVWNSSGYESVETLKMLEGLVQVYMPDYKYADRELAGKYSAAPDYPEVALAAIKEMVRQRGKFKLDENGMLVSGVLIRHLILPGQDLNSMDVIDSISDSFPEGTVLFSLMSQYTPMPGLEAFPALQRRITQAEYDRCASYLDFSEIEYGYYQSPESATDEMIPSFDGTGVK